MEKAKKKEKQKRQQYINKPIPSVGTYSPEITSTIYYNVFSKLNPYQIRKKRNTRPSRI